MEKVKHRKIKWYNAPDSQPWTLEKAISSDCEYWAKLNNENRLFGSYLYLKECKDSKKTGIYQLVFNGKELWFGTLKEINAVVKSMIKLLELQNEK